MLNYFIYSKIFQSKTHLYYISKSIFWHFLSKFANIKLSQLHLWPKIQFMEIFMNFSIDCIKSSLDHFNPVLHFILRLISILNKVLGWNGLKYLLRLNKTDRLNHFDNSQGVPFPPRCTISIIAHLSCCDSKKNFKQIP